MRSASAISCGRIENLLDQFAMTGIEAGNIQNVIDQRQQMRAAGMDVVQIFLVARRAQRPAGLAQHGFGKAQHGIQRRAQFMAHRGQEGGLGFAGCLGRFQRRRRARRRSSVSACWVASSSAIWSRMRWASPLRARCQMAVHHGHDQGLGDDEGGAGRHHHRQREGLHHRAGNQMAIFGDIDAPPPCR